MRIGSVLVRHQDLCLARVLYNVHMNVVQEGSHPLRKARVVESHGNPNPSFIWNHNLRTTTGSW